MKLTDADIKDIRTLLNALTQKEIANMFGVSQATISLIKNGKTRKEKTNE